MNKNILVLTYFSFKDALIQTYTLPYVRIIRKTIPPSSKITLFTLEKDNLSLSYSEEKKIKDSLSREGINWIHFRYVPFGAKAIVKWMLILPWLWFFVLRTKIDFIHCWATPAGAVGFCLSLTTGAHLVLDSYEPHAEAMIENGTWSKNKLAFRILFMLERWQSKRAYAVIAAASSMRVYALEKYGVSFNRFFVKPACVNLELFSHQNKKNEKLCNELMLTDKIVCVYAGKFGGIYQELEVFDFLKVAHSYWGLAFRTLLLTGHTDAEIKKYCDAAGLDESIIIRKFVPHEEVPNYMGLGDFGITPVKPAPTKRHCTPIKDGEYWALGLPVVIPDHISDDSEIIRQHNAGAILTGFSTQDYLEAVKKIDDLLHQPPKNLFLLIRSIAEKYRNFERAESVYRQLYV